MLNISDAFKAAMINPVRIFKSKITINGVLYTDEDAIKDIEIQRVGNNTKFFGYGICHRLNLKMVDLKNIIDPGTGASIKVELGVILPTGEAQYMKFPTFYLSQRNRAVEEKLTSLTAYDILDEATRHLVSELPFAAPYTIKGFIEGCADYLNTPLVLENIPNDDFLMALEYDEGGANFDGSESARTALDAAAEATGAIYYINSNDELCFKRLDVNGAAVLSMTPEEYIKLLRGDNRRLAAVCHTTELGDNVVASLDITGTTQYIRDNPFLELRKDIGSVMDNLLSCVGYLSINQYEADWRGNLTLEIGDKIDTIGVDGKVKTTYLLDDVIKYGGGFAQGTKWEYSASEAETFANPSTVGEALNSTAAKVDKINHEITLYSKQTEQNSEAIASLNVRSDNIVATVTRVEENIDASHAELNENIDRLTSKVEAAITPEDLTIEIQKIKEDGVNSITTTTGFTFNDEGLTVNKTGSEMTTQITEDGMVVYRDDVAVLTADNHGVDAVNLTAHQYLIIGNNSRFEDYIKDGEERTACFWIGG